MSDISIDFTSNFNMASINANLKIKELNTEFMKLKNDRIALSYGGRFDDNTKMSCVSAFGYALIYHSMYIQLCAFKLVKDCENKDELYELEIFYDIDGNIIDFTNDKEINMRENHLEVCLERMKESVRSEDVEVKSYDDFKTVIEYYYNKHGKQTKDSKTVVISMKYNARTGKYELDPYEDETLVPVDLLEKMNKKN